MSSDSEPSALTTGLLKKAVPAVQLIRHVKSRTLYGQILCNYGATLCELTVQRRYRKKSEELN